MTDKVVCYIKDGELNVDFYTKCAGYRASKDVDVRMATAEFTYPKPGMILALYYCINAHQYVVENKLYNWFKQDKIIELKGYYAKPQFIATKEHRGLSPKMLKAILPVLKKTYGVQYVILHAAGDSKLVQVYEKLGMKYAGTCPNFLQFDQLVEGLTGDDLDEEMLDQIKEALDEAGLEYKKVLTDSSRGNYPQNYMIGNIDDMITSLNTISTARQYRALTKECSEMDDFKSYMDKCTVQVLE